MEGPGLAHRPGHLAEMLEQSRAEGARLYRANQVAYGEISALKAQLRSAEAENAKLLGDLGRLTKEGEESQTTIRKLEEQISKQKVTIKVQSDQIAQRTTPSRPPTSGDLPSLQTTPTRSGGHQPTTPMSRQRSGPPPARQIGYQTTDRPLAIEPNPPPPAQRGQQLARIQEAEPSIELGADFTKIFRLTETWARNYTNAPDEVTDRSLPPNIISGVKQFTDPQTAWDLMSSANTRYLMVAKLINFQLTTLPFRPLVVKGFTDYYDGKITEMRVKFHEIIPIHIRRALMSACADTFREMTETDGFQAHIDGIVRHQVNEMWTFLEPFFGEDMPRMEAWNGLGEIWTEACRIGVLMLLKPSSFSLDYPPVGPSSLFNPAQMINRDTNFRQDPQTLSRMGVTVIMAVTPVVTETSFISDQPVPRILHHSNVLLRN